MCRDALERQPTVLLVADDCVTREASAMLWWARGYRVEVADAAQGLTLAGRRVYDVIVMDIRPAGEAGTEVLAALRAAAARTSLLVAGSDDPRAATVPAVELLERRAEGVNGNGDHLGSLIRALAAVDTPMVEFMALARALSDIFDGRETDAALAPVRPLLNRNRGAARSSRSPLRVVRALDGDALTPAWGSLHTLATEMGMTPRRLSRSFIEETGQPFRFWRRAVRVREALRRLTERDARVAQVAYAVGYEHPTQLDRDFREVVGCAPRVFRRLHERFG
jgi:AraC-like DNA-binding protein